MKIFVMADTHKNHIGDDGNREWYLENLDGYDMVIHAGDFDRYPFYREIKRMCKLVAVHGDSDDEKITNELPETTKLRIDGISAGVVHRGNYLNEFHDLAYKAKEMGVSILIFGHIHRFILDEIGGVILLCPGSPTTPRLSIGSVAEISVGDSVGEERSEGKKIAVRREVDGVEVEIAGIFSENVFCCFRGWI